MTQKIKKEDIVEIFDTEGIAEFEFYNQIFYVLYKFFKKYEFGHSYVVESSDLNFKLNDAVIKVFEAFGIYFSEKDVKGPTINYVVLTLPEFNSCLDYTKLPKDCKLNRLGSKVTYIMVENDLFNISNVKKIKFLESVHRCITNVHFMNKYLNVMDGFNLWKGSPSKDVLFYKRGLLSKNPNILFSNIYNNIYEECVQGIELIENAVKAKQLLISLVKKARALRRQGKTIVYYYENTREIEFNSGKSYADVHNDMEQIYTCFAAILTMKYGIKCIVPAAIKKGQNLKSSYLLARANMYVFDYFKMLENFPDVTVHNNVDMNYFCVLDREKLHRNYDRYVPKLTITAVRFDLEHKCFLNHDTVSATYEKNLIKILDVRDYWSGIKSKSKDEEISTLEELNKLLKDFGDILKENDVSIYEIFHQGNIILYEIDGETFLGYLERVSVTMPFTIYPGDYSYSSFSVDLSNITNEDINLETLQSIFIDVNYEDTLRTLASLGAKFSLKRLIYRLPDYADGIIFSNILYQYFNVQNFNDQENLIDRFASSDELGIWCESCRQFRKGSHYNDDSYYTRLYNLFNICQMRKENCLTFYGGLHPFISLTILLKPALF